MTHRDIITVISEMANGFRALDLPRPEAIVLSSHEDGMRVLRHIMQADYMIYSPGREPGVQPIEGENGVRYMQIEIYGTKIRWPSKRWAVPGSSGWREG